MIELGTISNYCSITVVYHVHSEKKSGWQIKFTVLDVQNIYQSIVFLTFKSHPVVQIEVGASQPLVSVSLNWSLELVSVFSSHPFLYKFCGTQFLCLGAAVIAEIKTLWFWFFVAFFQKPNSFETFCCFFNTIHLVLVCAALMVLNFVFFFPLFECLKVN